ncbi:MAG: M6 family metalloprotease domain-containing protein [Planctomycetota bacterium]|nr:MAG: M6 family metalloprotease domain-containing protein [Planctomycetota bacterium]
MSYLDGEVVVCGQHTGGDVQLKIYGDEFYARYECTQGYTVVYDTAMRRYCYASLAAGRFVSTGVPIGKPVPAGVLRHIKESPSVRNERFERRYDKLRPREAPSGSAPMRTFGPDDGLLQGRKLTHGHVRGLTILVEFADFTTTVTTADVDELLNGDNYTGNGNFSSVKKYFETVSDGNLHYTNTVIGPVRLAKPRSFYIGQLLVKEALDAAVSQFNVNLADFDSRGDGIVDGLMFLYAGNSQYSGELWPHNSKLTLQYGSIRTDMYLLTGLGRSKTDLRIGTICHENGHMLCRFPDMYDYGQRDGDHEKSAGIGRYCLMGSGNQLNNRRTPSAVCGYLRELVGWSAVVPINGPGEVEAPHGDYGKVLKYELDSLNEYFIIENRSQTGLDAHLPASGLAIYHCDRLGSNEWQDGTRTKHYQCALLQADGRFDLESNVNPGDSADLFADVAGVAAAHDTQPSTRRWDGADSELVVSDVSPAGARMRFRIGRSKQAVAEAETFPDLLIPDNDPNGVASPIPIAAVGAVLALEVEVHVIHSWISDLTLTLVAPDGSEAVLHDRTGHDGDDIDVTYRSAVVPALQGLVGKPVQGEWRLEAVDQASLDVGRLLRWRLRVDFEPGEQIVEGMAEPNLAIPDNDPLGVASSVPIVGGGTAREVLVALDITHTYIGDLEVDLVAPSGAIARLHDREGGSRDDLIRSYDTDSSASLSGLLGQPIQGDWSLRIRDRAGVDTGVLRRWSIEITT